MQGALLRLPAAGRPDCQYVRGHAGAHCPWSKRVDSDIERPQASRFPQDQDDAIS
jgi:hypothetical protein